ncbi:MAG: membrane protein insertase YidC [Leeuwenhoekiella sp.]
MEEKKFDIQSIIGFVLIGAILIFMLYKNQPTPEEIEAEKAKQEQVDASKASTENVVDTPQENVAMSPAQDSLAQSKMMASLGQFAYSSTLPSATDDVTTISNDVVELKISNKGGYITEARLKKFKTFDSIPVYLIKDGNNRFNLNLSTTDNRNLNTENMYFEPTLSKNGANQVLSMKLKVSANEYLEYRYELKPDDYMMDFGIKTVGLQNVVNATQPIHLDWELKGYRHAQSITYENRYSRLTYEYEDDKNAKLGQSGEDTEVEEHVDWLNFRQHFFSSILLTDTPFDEVKFSSKNLVEDEEIDTVFTKQYGADILLKPVNGELNYAMNMYYGPSDYQVLNSYEGRGLDKAMPLGWGIFGIINKYIIIPFFNILMQYLPAGIAIIFLTVCMKLLLSPVQYKQYLSQAKMKVLKPEINEISEKYKDNAMKKQQETMKVYSKAGASPLSGCIPAVLQIPVFYALFTFFPSAFSLRQKSFLWADDLSSYDIIAKLPFHIPFYGDHVSLFPILASIAIFIYMTMTTGQSMQQTQPGMPNMKFLMYLSPLMMLIFFNNYASGLSLYYFISNLITIGIMLVIKNYIIDDAKIHAKIQKNKEKPRKQNRFQKKMSEMMEQAEKQKK